MGNHDKGKGKDSQQSNGDAMMSWRLGLVISV